MQNLRWKSTLALLLCMHNINSCGGCMAWLYISFTCEKWDVHSINKSSNGKLSIRWWNRVRCKKSCTCRRSSWSLRLWKSLSLCSNESSWHDTKLNSRSNLFNDLRDAGELLTPNKKKTPEWMMLSVWQSDFCPYLELDVKFRGEWHISDWNCPFLLPPILAIWTNICYT